MTIEGIGGIALSHQHVAPLQGARFKLADERGPLVGAELGKDPDGGRAALNGAIASAGSANNGLTIVQSALVREQSVVFGRRLSGLSRSPRTGRVSRQRRLVSAPSAPAASLVPRLGFAEMALDNAHIDQPAIRSVVSNAVPDSLPRRGR
jgi:hypothetical protein